MSKEVETKIAAMIHDVLDAMGYDLVRVQIIGGGKYATLQIMAERKDGKGMIVDDCVDISKTVTGLIEQDADLADRYDLEVSSPGIDRPLMKIADYARFAGHIAKVELKTPLDGVKRFQGAIGTVSDAQIEFATDKAVYTVSIDDIDKAKLVLTDALLKAAESGHANP